MIRSRKNQRITVSLPVFARAIGHPRGLRDPLSLLMSEVDRNGIDGFLKRIHSANRSQRGSNLLDPRTAMSGYRSGFRRATFWHTPQGHRFPEVRWIRDTCR